jgi:4-amino-4-deoxy-L-arabinose transferase-like glycosyltransferase
LKRTFVIVLGLFAIALVARLPDLGASCNVDGVQHWFGRSRRFWEALVDGRLQDTYYSPHPGVSLMWLSGLSMQAFGVLDVINERAVVAATLPIALWSALVSPLSYWLLQRMLATQAERPRFDDVPLLTAFLLATEPFLVGNARTFHMDSLLTGFIWIAGLFTALTLLERRKLWAILAGVSLGLAVLTRMVAAVFALSLAIAFAVAFLRERPRTKTLPPLFALTAFTTLAITFLAWPALLLDPVQVLRDVFGATTRLVDAGHQTFAWGRAHHPDPGIKFYVGVLLMRVTPEVLLGTLSFPLLARHAPRRTLLLSGMLAAWYLPYTLGVLFGSKKMDRYLLFLFPLLVLFASVSASQVLRSATQRGWSWTRPAGALFAALAMLLLVWRGTRLALVHPVPLSWCAGYPGLACEKVIQLGTGEGFREVALWIRRHSKVKAPKVRAAYYHGAVMHPWLHFTRVKDAASAQFIVTYIASDQRQREQEVRQFTVGEPLHQVILDGRVYAEIYRGPLYREALKRGPREH